MIDQYAIRLAEIAQALPGWEIAERDDRIITGVTSDSRQVIPGSLFVALMGSNLDGHRFIRDAIQRGAAAVVGMHPQQDLSIPYFTSVDTRLALARLSAAFYRYPAQSLTVIGVTGTDGKTTTSNLIFRILQAADIKTGMISTVNAVIGAQDLDTGFHVTTPEAPDIQYYLAQMVAAGLKVVVLETTSHGLDQQRVAACDFDVGVITNITHEHIDYHGSFEAYRAAKARLFDGLSLTPVKSHHPQRAAVLNRDDPAYEFLSAKTQVRQVAYGLEGEADVRAVNINQRTDKLVFDAIIRDVAGKEFTLPIETNLVGLYNVYNCLAAVAVGYSVFNLPPQVVQAGVAALPGIPGRMQRIDLAAMAPKAQQFITIVDFAHTPNALRNSLMAARQMTRGRVISVFGSAGLRDRLKRGMMAQVSTELADISIFTAEDPRSESLSDILQEMADGAYAKGGLEKITFWRVPDRRDAIRMAVNLARPGDLVIACGKGHEQSMCFGEVEYPWDDRTAMLAALCERYGVPGPAMPELPT